MAAKPNSPPPSTATVLQSILREKGGVYVHVQLVGVCCPLIEKVTPTIGLTVNSQSTLSVMLPEELVPATELFDASKALPLEVTVTDVPKRLSVHVTPPLLVKLVVPPIVLPSALVVPLKVDSGHLVLRPLLSSVRFEFVDVPVKAVLTGVMVAFAAVGARASAPITTALSRSRRRMGTIMDQPFEGGELGAR